MRLSSEAQLVGTHAPGHEGLRPAAADESRSASPLPQGNSPDPVRVSGPVMITGAIVFGMVGVAAGFTWEYVLNHER